MIHAKISSTSQYEPLGSLVAAIHKAHKNNPSAKPLPKGYMEHSMQLPSETELAAIKAADRVEPVVELPVFRSRANR